MTVTWRFVPFDALTTTELYEVLQLRTEVFVMEQDGIYQDMDGSDHQAVHVLGASDRQLVAYARCFPAGVKFAEASIGRVITRQVLRGSGMGHELMRQAIACVFGQWGAQPIRIGAQARLEKFYLQHGFVKAGLPYIEDGIPHIEMLRPV
ncbi:MAG: GNAT family N-acetyltransferase [Polaromonas sp.]|uniref:GNAT family N-acetyltransferase n=1 Tax=Polaromonas sp. TaxID=1869339 RepID=UPI0027306B0B|nr:GNAT family N-acetyltransferase [Polaromonas sp.]MDP2450539.1 GNAT family N-acetyltransferase [Polaromonas sp.]MDP3247462.1 GNAT family N-acetyltransferase [Polaromonas sp.]MDP3755489.1 GNAT family N-acetyltransferase [Polaromonas sp.]MDP3825236.1 GNAT family N-acetyltransferase [Polaromonas sp.]